MLFVIMGGPVSCGHVLRVKVQRLCWPQFRDNSLGVISLRRRGSNLDRSIFTTIHIVLYYSLCCRVKMTVVLCVYTYITGHVTGKAILCDIVKELHNLVVYKVLSFL
jgi:hypothetical protein